MNNEIAHDNIIYIRDFSEIGGVETFTYELAKKYKDLDIAVIYKTAHKNQVKRVKKFCPIYKHINQRIECKVAVINYDVSIIDFICEGANIYQVVHGDYENKAYSWKPPTHSRIKEYIGVTKYICDSFKRITGLDNVIYGYNPLTIENEKKLVLISMTRLSKIKGKNRMIKLAEALDLTGINYIWYVFTNDINAIDSPNVIFMKPRLDVSYWLQQADYLVQLSDTEACSYSINEALYRNIPIIVTPLPYLKEIGVKDGENAYIMKFDCSNVSDIVSKIENIPKFNFKHLEDNYRSIFADGKSKYEEEKNMEVKVRAKRNFTDTESGQKRVGGISEWTCDKDRADFLVSKNAVEIIEEIKEKAEGKIEYNIEKDVPLKVEIRKQTPKKKKTTKK